MAPAVFPTSEVSPLQSHIYLKQQATIRGLPANLRDVPNDPKQWKLWAKAVTAYREKRRRECANDGRQQELERQRCINDTAYFITVWLPILEVRSTDNRPPAWRPFILFPFQVHMVRWIEWVMDQSIEDGNGRSDGIVEKSRDMGGTYLFCAVFAKHFLFDQVFVAGIVGKKYEDVDHPISTGTVFYKIRSMLGIEDAVPPALRLPAFLQPRGFLRDAHSTLGGIINPEPGKTCAFVGETTTKLSGVSLRNTVRLNDEAARIPTFGQSWINQQATTDHRFALSTASLEGGPAFYNMAEVGRKGLFDPTLPAPALLRLEWDLHPFHTPKWFQGQLARARSNGDSNEFSREYEINYFAERGAKVYPRFEQVRTEHCPYDPHGGPLYCWIDPGTRDPAAIVWVQGDLIRGGWNVVNSFEGKGGEDVMFYASVLTGTYLSGERQYDYSEYENIDEIMAFTASITQTITYIGDPAGTQRGGRGDDSSTWYKELAIAAKQIGLRSIFVQTVTANDARSYEARKQAVNALTPLLRFHENRGGARVLFCLTQSAYRKPTREREALEPAKPEHGPESHIRSAVEFGCVWFKLMAQANRHQKAGPRKPPPRHSLSGNIVSGSQRSMFDPRVRNTRRNGNPW